MILLPPPLSLLKRFPFCSSLERPALRALRSLPRPRRDPAHAAIKARGIRCRFPSLRRQSRAAGGAVGPRSGSAPCRPSSGRATRGQRRPRGARAGRAERRWIGLEIRERLFFPAGCRALPGGYNVRAGGHGLLKSDSRL